MTNRAITRNLVEAAKPGARLIFCSTIMVYAPNTAWGLIPDAYGLEKLINERMFRRLCKRLGHQGYVLRLGHVLGELQNISRSIRDQVLAGSVTLPDGGTRPSNTVFTATIAQALVDIVNGKTAPGTFDLITSPQWTWRDVYAHYARESGISIDVISTPGSREKHNDHLVPGRIVKRLMKYMSSTEFVRERLRFVLGLLPEKLNRTVHVRYLQARALSEISGLKRMASSMNAAQWRGIAVKPIPSMPDTETCLRAFPLWLAETGQDEIEVLAP